MYILSTYIYRYIHIFLSLGRGELIYFGAIPELSALLAAANLGCPAGYNIADHALNLIQNAAAEGSEASEALRQKLGGEKTNRATRGRERDVHATTPFIYTHTHTHVFIYIYIYMCVCVCVCVYVYIYIYICVYMCIYIYIYIYIHIYLFFHVTIICQGQYQRGTVVCLCMRECGGGRGERERGAREKERGAREKERERERELLTQPRPFLNVPMQKCQGECQRCAVVCLCA